MKDKNWLNKELDKSITGFNGRELSRYEMGRLDGYTHASMLLDELDEPKKPVIPKFVSEYIEQSKKDNDSINQVFAFMDDKEDKDLWHWLFPSVYEEKRANQEVFMRAWLDGYEVEKEKKYQVIIRDGEYIRLYLCKHGDNVIIGTNDNYIEKCPEVTYLTEQEIKTIDERFWAFAQEVTE